MLTLTYEDLGLTDASRGQLTQAQIETKIVDVLALAKIRARCLFTPTADADSVAAGRAILREALLRWVRRAGRGHGDVQTQSAGPFGITVDTRTGDGSVVWPTEWADLAGLCGAAQTATPVGSFPAADNYARLFQTGC
ncbi:hypothetical protein ACQBAU_16300 [Propionibacteriaceae bacterium Y2011]